VAQRQRQRAIRYRNRTGISNWVAKIAIALLHPRGIVGLAGAMSLRLFSRSLATRSGRHNGQQRKKAADQNEHRPQNHLNPIMRISPKGQRQPSS